MPRPYQWFGVTPRLYGETNEPHEWTPEALEIQERVYKATGVVFDSPNVNCYRPGGTDYLVGIQTARMKASGNSP
jgi:hypothetical protein